MNKFLNWLFGLEVKPESKEEQEKRIAEINATYDDLQRINREIKQKEKEIEALNRILN